MQCPHHGARYFTKTCFPEFITSRSKFASVPTNALVAGVANAIATTRAIVAIFRRMRRRRRAFALRESRASVREPCARECESCASARRRQTRGRGAEWRSRSSARFEKLRQSERGESNEDRIGLERTDERER